jgi:hypothetical protein
MTDDRTETLRRERKRFFWKIDGDLLFHDVFKEIARDGQTVTALLLILARQPIPPNKKGRLRLEKAGLWPPKDPSFSFPVREAPYHGLTVRGLSRGLQRLHEVGIIDRIKPGSAMKGDFSLYVLSERWRGFGRLPDGTIKPTFKAIPWAKPLTEEEKKKRKEEDKKRRDANGKFIRRRGRKNLVVALLTTTKAPSVVNLTTTTLPVVVNSTINTCGKPLSVVVNSTMLLSAPSLDSDLREVKTGRKSNSAPKRNTSHPITDDPQAIAALAAALSSIVGHLPGESMAKKKPGRPRRNLDPNMAPRLDHDYDPDLGPWAEDESMTASLGRGGTVH